MNILRDNKYVCIKELEYYPTFFTVNKVYICPKDEYLYSDDEKGLFLINGTIDFRSNFRLVSKTIYPDE